MVCPLRRTNPATTRQSRLRARHYLASEILFGVIVAPVAIALLMLPWYIALGFMWLFGTTDPFWILVLVVPSAVLEYGAICSLGLLVRSR